MTRVIAANFFLRFPAFFAFFGVDVESLVVALTLRADDEGITMRSTLSLHFGYVCNLRRRLVKVKKLRVSRDACKETVFVAAQLFEMAWRQTVRRQRLSDTSQNPASSTLEPTAVHRAALPLHQVRGKPGEAA
jgi:hypothetical protein